VGNAAPHTRFTTGSEARKWATPLAQLDAMLVVVHISMSSRPHRLRPYEALDLIRRITVEPMKKSKGHLLESRNLI
jgi:hypothetical protein